MAKGASICLAGSSVIGALEAQPTGQGAWAQMAKSESNIKSSIFQDEVEAVVWDDSG
jgi:hypothetical protein